MSTDLFKDGRVREFGSKMWNIFAGSYRDLK